MLRDLTTEATQTIRIDSKMQYDALRAFGETCMPGTVGRLEHAKGERPIFDLFGIEEEIARALARRVLANWTPIDGVNDARSEPPGLVRVGDLPWLAAGFVGMTAWLGDAGMAPFLPGAAMVLAAVATVRWVLLRRLAWRVDRAIDLEAWRTAKGPVPMH